MTNPTERPEERDSLAEIEKRLTKYAVPKPWDEVIRTLLNEVKELREENERLKEIMRQPIQWEGKLKQMEEALREARDWIQLTAFHVANERPHEVTDPVHLIHQADAALNIREAMRGGADEQTSEGRPRSRGPVRDRGDRGRLRDLGIREEVEREGKRDDIDSGAPRWSGSPERFSDDER
jgi:hypothetical protein